MEKKAPLPVELRHEAVRDILTQMPSWTLRWGTLALSSVVFLLVGLTFIIPYPNTIKGTIVLSPQKVPVDLYVKQTGRITYWAVSEGQAVQKGADLAMIESGGVNYSDFITTEKFINNFYQCWLQGQECVLMTENLSLVNHTTIFPQYTFVQLKKVYEEYIFFQKNNFLKKEKENLSTQIQSLESLQAQILKEKVLLEKNALIAQKQFTRDKTLKEKKVYAEIDAENSEKNYLQEQHKVEVLQSQYLNYNLRITQIQKSIQELEKQEAWQEQNLRADVKNITEKLRADLQAWRVTHILQAEIDGKVSLGKFWATNQYVQAGEKLLTINPLEKAMTGQVLVRAEGFGKIKVGQRVLICLQAFDCQEYGKIEGQVQSISQGGVEDNNYRLQVVLPTPLRTINNFIVPSDNQVWQGEAYIQTDNSLLIEKIFYQLRYLWQR